MHDRKTFSQRVDEFLSGKGFYIVLFACVAVIGVSAWLLLFSQYSPLAFGDEGDYLDTMGDLGTQGPENDTGKAGTGGQVPVTPSKPDKGAGNSTGGSGGATEGGSEGGKTSDSPVKDGDLPPQPNTPPGSSGALTVQDDPGGKSDAPETNGTGGAPADGSSGAPAPETGSPEPENPNDRGEAPSPAVGSVEDITFIWPVSGEIAVGHSPAALIYDITMDDWRTHVGVDISARLGTKVLSCANGTVKEVRSDGLYGTTVVIDHGAGVVSTCSNLAGTPTVAVGDAVTMGSVIGSVGSTALYETGDASHLHFAMTVNGEPVDPLDYLPEKNQ